MLREGVREREFTSRNEALALVRQSIAEGVRARLSWSPWHVEVGTEEDDWEWLWAIQSCHADLRDELAGLGFEESDEPLAGLSFFMGPAPSYGTLDHVKNIASLYGGHVHTVSPGNGWDSVEEVRA